MLFPPMNMQARGVLKKASARRILAEYLSGRRVFRNLDLRGVDLSWKELPGVDFSGCDLRDAHLEGVRLPDALLGGVNFERARLASATLAGAKIEHAQFDDAVLVEADLRRTKIRHCRLSGVVASDADFSRARFSDAWIDACTFGGSRFRSARFTRGLLSAAEFVRVDLANAVFDRAEVDSCTFAETDLSTTKGLETLVPRGPSVVGAETLFLSRQRIPAAFLRGCGLPDAFIEYLSSPASTDTIEYYSCFISYSSGDDAFVKRLHADLQELGIRCWFAPRDLPTGSRTRRRIDEAIRTHDRLLVVLSRNAIGSPWVEKEVETAFEKERVSAEDVLLPIRIDDAVFQTDEAWAADLRRSRNIGDFRRWRSRKAYVAAVNTLAKDLRQVGEPDNRAFHRPAHARRC